MISSIAFVIVALLGIGFFIWQIRKISANINAGRDKEIKDRVPERLNKLLLVAFGQKKMLRRPWPAFLHGLIYVGFLVINVEVIEILIDGTFGSHRVLGFLGPVYSVLMAMNEILGFLVIFACLILLYRRNVMKVRRFHGTEMRAWPRMDANIILVTEIVLMIALFMFNGADMKGHEMRGVELAGFFPISQMFLGWFPNDVNSLATIAAVGWWIHIVGILLFLNYLPSSKHFHIILAFPNVYYSKLEPQGKFSSNPAITHEIKAMLDPGYQVPPAPEGAEPQRFGAKDIEDLSWKQLLDAYTCTECGRCTDVCPANITGKLLSPRKVVMDTRDRMEEKHHSPIIFKPNNYSKDGAVPNTEEHTLLRGYVTPEELWACTTCNACVTACPVNIDQLSSIMDMRRFLVLEESAAPQSLNVMFNNIENNGAPWAFSPSDRLNWAEEIYVKDNE